MEPQDEQQALDVIEAEARRMERLSSRLMQLIIAAQPLSERKPVSLPEFLKQTGLRLEPTLRKKRSCGFSSIVRR